MKKYFLMLPLSLISSAAMAQDPAAAKPRASTTPATTASPATVAPALTTTIAITANSTPVELARAALAAQGGDKFKNLKSTMLIGTVDLYAPNSTQSIPGKFVIVTSDERVRMEIDARPIVSFKQIYDGQQSYSSLPGVETPPATKFGPTVLAKFDQPGYTVSAVPDDAVLSEKKKLRKFRIVDAEGNTTDFYIDPTTARIMAYVIPYKGLMFSTENTKMKEIDGVLVPFNFTQRLNMQQGAFFAEFKVKEAKLNQPVGDDVFVIK